jgi:hypothetical protein
VGGEGIAVNERTPPRTLLCLDHDLVCASDRLELFAVSRVAAVPVLAITFG